LCFTLVSHWGFTLVSHGEIEVATSQSDRDNIRTATGRARLTKKFPPNDGQYNQPIYRAVGSATNTSIGFRISSGTWVARTRFGGQYHFLRLGSVDDVSFKTAEQKAKAFADSLTSGIKTGVTVRLACLEYLEDRKTTMAPTQYQRVRNRLQNAVIGRTKQETTNKFGNELAHNVVKAHKISKKLLDELKAKDLFDWHRELVPPGLKGEALRKARSSANHILIALKAALNFSFSMDLCQTDAPWKKVKAFQNARRMAQADDAVLTPSDRKELRTVARQEFPAIAGILEVLLMTGARRAEVRRARIVDYDPKSKTLRLVNYKGAGNEGRERFLLCGPLGIDVILQRATTSRIPKTQAIFEDPDTGKQWSESKLTRKFRELFNAAGLSHLPMNVTRHSFISEAVSSGIDLHTLSTHCGTSILMISQTYARQIKSQSEDGLKRLRKVL
jgi:integrase